MNAAEAVKVLTLAACYDGRQVGETDARAWADLLGDVPVDDALAAVREHFREEGRRLMPVDVLRRCTVERDPWTRR